MFFAAASQITAKPPPPRPLETGCATPIASVPATAASAAEPPFCRTSIAMREAVAFSEATAKRGGLGGGAASGGAVSVASSGGSDARRDVGATATGVTGVVASPQPAGNAAASSASAPSAVKVEGAPIAREPFSRVG